MIEFACPSCDGTHAVEDGFAGYTAKCSHCGQLVEIPSGGEEGADAPPEAAVATAVLPHRPQAVEDRPAAKATLGGRLGR